MRLLPLLLLPALLSAGEAPTVPPAGSATGPAPVENGSGIPRIPALGLTTSDHQFDPADPGLPVVDVKPGGTAAVLGLQPGDRLLTINGRPVVKPDDIKTALQGCKVGDPISIEFARQRQKQTVGGTMLERPRPVLVQEELRKTQSELARIQALAAEKAKEPSLAEIIQVLKDLDRRLPKAAAEFKKQYPNGEFDVRISIWITSDKTSPDAIELGNLAGTATGAKPKP